MEKATFQIDDPMLEETQTVAGDFVVNYTREQKVEAQRTINKLSKEFGYELTMQPKYV